MAEKDIENLQNMPEKYKTQFLLKIRGVCHYYTEIKFRISSVYWTPNVHSFFLHVLIQNGLHIKSMNTRKKSKNNRCKGVRFLMRKHVNMIGEKYESRKKNCNITLSLRVATPSA